MAFVHRSTALSRAIPSSTNFGRFMVIKGNSGSGKTTLVQNITSTLASNNIEFRYVSVSEPDFPEQDFCLIKDTSPSALVSIISQYRNGVLFIDGLRSFVDSLGNLGPGGIPREMGAALTLINQICYYNNVYVIATLNATDINSQTGLADNIISGAVDVYVTLDPMGEPVHRCDGFTSFTNMRTSNGSFPITFRSGYRDRNYFLTNSDSLSTYLVTALRAAGASLPSRESPTASVKELINGNYRFNYVSGLHVYFVEVDDLGRPRLAEEKSSTVDDPVKVDNPQLLTANQLVKMSRTLKGLVKFSSRETTNNGKDDDGSGAEESSSANSDGTTK